MSEFAFSLKLGDRVIATETKNEITVGDTGTVRAAWLKARVLVQWDNGKTMSVNRERLLPEAGTVVVERLTNRYVCKTDGEWEDEWCCACDDECPTCGKDYSPEDSVVEETVVLRVKIDDCPVCGEPHEF